MTNPGHRFRPGERVAVRLTRRDADSGLVVPKAALLHDAYGGTWVYVATRAAGLRRASASSSPTSAEPLAVLSQGPPEARAS